jgi:hypothetical protein
MDLAHILKKMSDAVNEWPHQSIGANLQNVLCNPWPAFYQTAKPFELVGTTLQPGVTLMPNDNNLREQYRQVDRPQIVVHGGNGLERSMYIDDAYREQAMVDLFFGYSNDIREDCYVE